jgi:Tol biopolymer transport system component
MPLSAGTRLGPYEILSALGAGGMGEVWKAKDPRLDRTVALKVLPESFFEDKERVARFEREAKLLAALNHPNIAAIYSFEEIPGIPGSSGRHVLVQELLEGETLRSELDRGKLSPRRAIDYAVQIANGLAAAHEKGIVHRDLKPENLVVTKDGRVKILDFGLAKLIQPDAPPGEETSAPTATPGTEPGVVMGTVGYMSPEQVRGRPADAHSDIFSFGAILYEMLTGNRAFRGDSAADTMSAILKEDPPDLSVANPSVSPGLDRIVRHCLEKNPERRFQSARDLGFALETGPTSVAGGAAVAAAGGARKLPVLPILLALAILAIPIAAVLARRSVRSTVPIFQRLSFRRGNVLHAMFTPDAASVIYAAAWEGNPAEVFTTRIDGTDSRPLGLKNANVVAVSSRGEIAVLRKSADTRITTGIGEGTLATVSLSGGEPRDVLDKVVAADWNPEGTQMAIVRQRIPTAAAGVWVPAEWTVEFPIGHVLYRTSSRITGILRFSPDGLRLAFTERSDKGMTVEVLDLSGHVKTLGEGVAFRAGLAWWHRGKEIVTATNPSSQESRIESVDLEGRVRVLYRLPGWTFLWDVSRDGRLLVAFRNPRGDLAFGSADLASERNLGWLSSSGIVDLSSDCREVLFGDAVSIPGKAPQIFLRGTDGSPAVHLGDAWAFGLSPDGRWVLTMESPSSTRFTLLPTGAGEPTTVPFGDLKVWGAQFLSDGESIGFTAIGRDGAERAYVVSRRGGPPHLIASATSSAIFSPDGTAMATSDAKGHILIYPIEGGQPRTISGFDPTGSLIQWSRDGWIYVRNGDQVPTVVERFEIASGRKEAWRTMMPADASGVIAIQRIVLTRDARCWAYSFNRALSSDLYMISGLD